MIEFRSEVWQVEEEGRSLLWNGRHGQGSLRTWIQRLLVSSRKKKKLRRSRKKDIDCLWMKKERKRKRERERESKKEKSYKREKVTKRKLK